MTTTTQQEAPHMPFYKLPDLSGATVARLVGKDPPKGSIEWYVRNFVRAQGCPDV